MLRLVERIVAGLQVALKKRNGSNILHKLHGDFDMPSQQLFKRERRRIQNTFVCEKLPERETVQVVGHLTSRKVALAVVHFQDG